MVLVDTSVWIRFLMGREPFVSGLDSLLEREEAAGHDLIYGELLISDSGDRGTLLSLYQAIHKAAGIPHDEVALFVRSNSLTGRGIGWVDAHLLASALVADMPLWTADQRLAEMANQLGVGYPSSPA